MPQRCWPRLARLQAVTSGGKVNKEAALDTLIKTSKEEKLRDALQQLQPFLLRKATPRKVAQHFGWSEV